MPSFTAQEYASAQRMIILFLRGLHEGRSENTNQVKSEKRLPEQIGNWLGHTKSAERMKQGAPECIQRTTYVKCHVTFCACAVIVKTPTLAETDDGFSAFSHATLSFG
eukprot:TRINITY_DN50_c0_g1_i15.p2 TRINITY_DN50_c0_g1~~TRINITY_DN50_c0_g1_i15.p2  ORF type:complete len:108 (+),score=5.94 TRINITY_DN50_c0_g1_i15:102-425(+)